MAKHNTVDSTMKHLVNMVGNVREIVNNLYHYNPATMPLTGTQISQLLRSPLGSIVKNIIFFHMVYYAVLRELRREYILELLEKIGLKEQADRYYEWLEEYEHAHSHRPHRSHDEIYHPELLHPHTPKPEKSAIDEMFDELHRLETHYALALTDLSFVQRQHNLLIQSLLTHHHHHVKNVCNHALEYGVKLAPDVVMTKLPKAIEAYRSARSVSEEIRAMAMLKNEGETLNNVVRLQQFLGSATLETSMKRYHVRLEELNNEFSNRSAQLVECKMRCATIEQQKVKIESDIAKAKPVQPKPEPKAPAKNPELSYTANPAPNPAAAPLAPEPSVAPRPENIPEPPAKSAFAAEKESAHKFAHKGLTKIFEAGLKIGLAEAELEVAAKSAPAA